MPKATNQLDKDGMTAGERAEAKRELVLAGRVQWWRELMKKGKVVKAAEYAKRYGFEEMVAEDLLLITSNPIMTTSEQAEPLVRPEAVAVMNAIGLATEADAFTTPVATLQDDRGELREGWPVKAEAEVSRFPVNPRMVVAMLPDGREATLWNHKGGRWTLGSKVRVKLVEVVGGEAAYYEGDYDDAVGTSGV